jgi:hypothetical protein
MGWNELSSQYGEWKREEDKRDTEKGFTLDNMSCEPSRKVKPIRSNIIKKLDLRIKIREFKNEILAHELYNESEVYKALSFALKFYRLHMKEHYEAKRSLSEGWDYNNRQLALAQIEKKSARRCIAFIREHRKFLDGWHYIQLGKLRIKMDELEEQDDITNQAHSWNKDKDRETVEREAAAHLLGRY